MDPPLVSVRGEATLEVEPEIATLTVVVAGRDKDRDKAFAALQRRADELGRVIDRYGEAVEVTQTGSVRVRPVFKDGRPSEKVAGYVALLDQAVRVADFTVLGDLVADLVDQELSDVAGPWWGLRVDSPIYRQARMAATADAVQRAREYAEALGAELDSLVELADTGLLSEPRAGMGQAAAPMMAPMAAPGRLLSRGEAPPPPPLELDPVRQFVRASVEARFTITRPDLRAGGESG